MDKKEELLSYFESEINEVAEKEIAGLEQEMEDIRKRTVDELEKQAQLAIKIKYEQELSEINADHAIALSHLNDENNRKLMNERNRLVHQIFEDAKQELLAFTKEKNYVEQLKKKLEKLNIRKYPNANLYVAKQDEAILKELIQAYGAPCNGMIDPTIMLGGFRLECADAGVIHDETIDSAIHDAKAWFYEASGLTIR